MRSPARPNEVVCAAMEAEGIKAEVQYPPMNHYELFQPSLSRLPVAVEYADRLDPTRMSFPVAEAAGLRESIYFMETTFRDGEQGVAGRGRRAREDPGATPRSCRRLTLGPRTSAGSVAVHLEQRVQQRLGGVEVARPAGSRSAP